VQTNWVNCLGFRLPDLPRRVRRQQQRPRRIGAVGDKTALVMKARLSPVGALLSIRFLTVDPGRSFISSDGRIVSWDIAPVNACQPSVRHVSPTIRNTLAGFRRGTGEAFGPCRLSAFMTAIRASIVGPPRDTSISASIAACHSGRSDSVFGRAVMYVAASCRMASVRPSG
jgi:hypothetical protein